MAKAGDNVGGCRLIARIGSGGQGDVFSASNRPEFEADLIVVERNPLEDLTLQDVLLVINDGKVGINRLKW